MATTCMQVGELAVAASGGCKCALVCRKVFLGFCSEGLLSTPCPKAESRCQQRQVASLKFSRRARGTHGGSGKRYLNVAGPNAVGSTSALRTKAYASCVHGMARTDAAKKNHQLDLRAATREPSATWPAIRPTALEGYGRYGCTARKTAKMALCWP